jgi:hypothetical protein
LLLLLEPLLLLLYDAAWGLLVIELFDYCSKLTPAR